MEDTGERGTVKKGSRKAVVTSEVGLTKPAPAVVPKVNVQATDLEVEKWKGDILVVGLFEGSSSLGFEEEEENAGELKKLDDFVGGVLKEIASEEEFKGKVGQSSFARLAGYGFKRVGLGKLEAVVVEEGKTPSTKPWKGLGESVAAVSKTAQATSVAIFITHSKQLSETVKVTAAAAITSGYCCLLGLAAMRLLPSPPLQTQEILQPHNSTKNYCNKIL